MSVCVNVCVSVLYVLEQVCLNVTKLQVLTVAVCLWGPFFSLAVIIANSLSMDELPRVNGSKEACVCVVVQPVVAHRAVYFSPLFTRSTERK